jgi:hypothetical protein
MVGEQLLQTLDVIVVNDPSGLLRRPLETLAPSPVHLCKEILPSGEPVLTRDRQLSVTQ